MFFFSKRTILLNDVCAIGIYDSSPTIWEGKDAALIEVYRLLRRDAPISVLYPRPVPVPKPKPVELIGIETGTGLTRRKPKLAPIRLDRNRNRNCEEPVGTDKNRLDSIVLRHHGNNCILIQYVYVKEESLIKNRVWKHLQYKNKGIGSHSVVEKTMVRNKTPSNISSLSMKVYPSRRLYSWDFQHSVVHVPSLPRTLRHWKRILRRRLFQVSISIFVPSSVKSVICYRALARSPSRRWVNSSGREYGIQWVRSRCCVVAFSVALSSYRWNA